MSWTAIHGNATGLSVEADQRKAAPAMESVLVGVDRSEGSRRALRFALQRARVNDWRVTVVNVVNWSRYSTFHTHEDNERRPVTSKAELREAQREIIDVLMAEAEAEGLLEGLEVKTLVRHGRPSEVLAELGAKPKHDLIVVGRTGDSNLKVAIFGSTASRLVQHAPVPVVVVP